MPSPAKGPPGVDRAAGAGELVDRLIGHRRVVGREQRAGLGVERVEPPVEAAGDHRPVHHQRQRQMPKRTSQVGTFALRPLSQPGWAFHSQADLAAGDVDGVEARRASRRRNARVGDRRRTRTPSVAIPQWTPPSGEPLPNWWCQTCLPVAESTAQTCAGLLAAEDQFPTFAGRARSPGRRRSHGRA